MDFGKIAISTHVLDMARGKPAIDVPVRLERGEKSGQWRTLGSARTDQSGRCAQLVADGEILAPGIYKLSFDTENYYASHGFVGLYPVVEVTFHLRDGEAHYHIPLLLSPNSYTTYRGS